MPRGREIAAIEAKAPHLRCVHVAHCVEHGVEQEHAHSGRRLDRQRLRRRVGQLEQHLTQRAEERGGERQRHTDDPEL